jgi:ferric-dicitrate binding protein FerR (iron transport regulator)
VRRRRIRFVGFAAAASVAVLAVTFASYFYFSAWRAGPASAGADSSVRVSGSAQSLRFGEPFAVGADHGAVLEAADGVSLRLDRRSKMVVRAPDVIALEGGRLYFETTSLRSRLSIETPVGRVTHLGTRYAVELRADTMIVQVRDGLVRVTTNAGRTIDVAAGWRIVLDAAGVERERATVARYGDPWHWVDALMPSLRVDGRLLSEVLEEIAMQSGRRLEYADAEVQREAYRIRLKGPYVELTVGDRLFAVLVTTGLEALEDGELIIIRRGSVVRPEPASL